MICRAIARPAARWIAELAMLAVFALAIPVTTVEAQQAGYPRPKGATPLTVPLVPAYVQCMAPNRTHGAPLAFGSCAPPNQVSARGTVGTADSNGLPTTFTGSVRLRVVPGNPEFGAPPDLAIQANMFHVYASSDLGPYVDPVRLVMTLRLTDRRNGPSGAETGTMQDIDFVVPMDCLFDRRYPELGSTCFGSTTVNTLLPGALSLVNLAIWELGQVRIYDGGADRNPDTTGDNRVLVTQGIFAP